MRGSRIKMLATALTVVMSLGSGASMATESYYDNARVLDVQPIVRTIQRTHPERRCVDRYREEIHHRDSDLGAISGAIIGGVIGSHFGKGHGRGAATFAGALLGGAIGHDAVVRHPGYDRDCDYLEYRDTTEEVVGYRVKYRYGGEVYWTRTQEHPGRWLKVRVTVHPLSE